MNINLRNVQLIFERKKHKWIQKFNGLLRQVEAKPHSKPNDSLTFSDN